MLWNWTNKTHLETQSFAGLEHSEFFISVSIVSLELIVSDPDIKEEERSNVKLGLRSKTRL